MVKVKVKSKKNVIKRIVKRTPKAEKIAQIDAGEMNEIMGYHNYAVNDYSSKDADLAVAAEDESVGLGRRKLSEEAKNYHGKLIGLVKGVLNAKVEEYCQGMFDVKSRHFALEEEKSPNLFGRNLTEDDVEEFQKIYINASCGPSEKINVAFWKEMGEHGFAPQYLPEIEKVSDLINVMGENVAPRNFRELVDILELDKDFFFNTTVEKEVEKWKRENGLYNQEENNLKSSGNDENKMTEMIGTYLNEEESIETIYDGDLGEQTGVVLDIKLTEKDEKNIEKIVKEFQPEDKRTREEVVNDAHSLASKYIRENKIGRISDKYDILGNMMARENALDDAHKRVHLSMRRYLPCNGAGSEINLDASLETREKEISEVFERSKAKSYSKGKGFYLASEQRQKDFQTAREKPYVAKR